MSLTCTKVTAQFRKHLPNKTKVTNRTREKGARANLVRETGDRGRPAQKRNKRHTDRKTKQTKTDVFFKHVACGSAGEDKTLSIPVLLFHALQQATCYRQGGHIAHLLQARGHVACCFAGKPSIYQFRFSFAEQQATLHKNASCLGCFVFLFVHTMGKTGRRCFENRRSKVQHTGATKGTKETGTQAHLEKQGTGGGQHRKETKGTKS